MFVITANQDILLTRGDTATFDIRIMDGAEEYIIQDGDSVEFSVRKTLDGPVIIQKTGRTITLEHSDTIDLPNGKYIYDVTVIQADGAVSTIIPNRRLVIGAEV